MTHKHLFQTCDVKEHVYIFALQCFLTISL